jgi:two-component system C4-dicarboxylate transport sensor histidine kinase DctB
MSFAARRRTFSRQSQRLIVGMAMLVCVAVIIWNLVLLVKQRAFEELTRSGESRAVFYAKSLQDSLEKYRHLPYVLARDERIRDLLKGEVSEIKVNPHLEDFATATGALIFILDKAGTALAASNWRTDHSLVGYNYGFRPYFIDARRGQPGGYYAVGLQTGKPGYFIACPVLDVGELLGAVVVKVNLAPVEKSWTDGKETIMVSDAYGVIILASESSWKYSTLQKLSEATIKRLLINQYPGTSLEPLAIHRDNTRNGTILSVDRKPYFEVSRQLPDYGWRLHYLLEIQSVENMVRLTVFVSAALLLILFLSVLYYRERRQKLISRQEAKEATEIHELNLRLQEEIAEHERTEKSLRATQKELIQAGKLAALGRMSAAVAHELNQPVTAIRTFLASCRIFIERGQIDNVEKNLSLISALTDRMAGITGQLKTFSRKSKGRSEEVDLVERVQRVLEFTRPQLDKYDISVGTNLPEPGSARIAGGTVRVEQVLSNILKNGMDAVKNCAVRHIHITVRVQSQKVVALFEDSGKGISADALEYLFEPFFTTKESGEGLGLGLSISYGILQDIGGTIRAENRQEGGARFILEFPLSTFNALSQDGK